MDEFSTLGPIRDLECAPKVKLDAMVATVLAVHDDQTVGAAQAFKAIDIDSSLSITQLYVREQLCGGK